MSEFENKPMTSDSELALREEMRLRELLAGLDSFIVGIEDEDDDEDWDDDDEDWDDDDEDDDWDDEDDLDDDDE